MTAIGTGYDLSNSVFSNDGRMFQVEYAMKAVENGGTAIGIKCRDGVVFALERLVASKLVKPNANKRIVTVDRHMGLICTGLEPDAIPLVRRAREESRSWRNVYKAPISTTTLAHRLADFMQAYTCYSSVRPFGVMSIIGGWDAIDEPRIEGLVGHGPSVKAGGLPEGSPSKTGGPFLYMLEPSGECLGYYGAAAGKGRQAAKAELEKLNLHEDGGISIEEGVREAARIIMVAHEDNKDKKYEVEMTWVSSPDGPTGGQHQRVPQSLIDEALEMAKQALNEDDDDQGDEVADAGAEGQDEGAAADQEGDRMQE